MKIFAITLIVLGSYLNLSAESKRPNIILLFVDDQRADTIGAHDNPHIQTPNLDKLSDTGFSFRRNYCASSFSGAVCVASRAVCVASGAVCLASRAMLMTGRHWQQIPARNKYSGWSKLPLLPRYLHDKADYNTFIVGKWHNGQTTLKSAFSSGSSVYMGGMVDHANFSVQDYADGKLTDKRKAKEFSSTEFASSAINYINKAEANKPFFLYVAFTALC